MWKSFYRRVSSSIFSAAKAAKNHLRASFYGNEKIVSISVVNNGVYDIHKELVTSFPIKHIIKFEVVKGNELNYKFFHSKPIWHLKLISLLNLSNFSLLISSI